MKMDMNLQEDMMLYGDEDEDEYVEVIVRIRKRYTVRPRPNFFAKYDESEFRRRFRFGKETTVKILGFIENNLRSRTNRNQAVSPLNKLLLTLRFYATGTFQMVVADFGGIHVSTLCRIIKQVSRALAAMRPQFIKLPATNNEIIRIQTEFYQIARFPRVVGAIDCTHVKIQSPGGDEAETFRNRKGLFSLNVQAVCDSNRKFLDIVARWPGSTHDSTIFNASRLRARFLNQDFGNCLLLGDSGYACSDFLITPMLNPQTEAERLFCESQIRTRNVVERCFGAWKRRFPALSFGLRTNPIAAQAIVVATAILHNCAQDEGEADPEIEPDVEAAIRALQVREPHRHENQNNNMRRSLIETYFSNIH